MSTWPGVKTWTAVVVTVPDLQTYVSDAFTALHWSELSKSADYTVAASDGHAVSVKMDASGAARTVNLYTAVGNAGAVISVRKTDTSANTVTVDPSGAQTVDGRTTWVLTSQYDFLLVKSDGTNWHVVASNLRPTVLSKSGTYTVAVIDGQDVLVRCDASGGAFTVNFPTAVGYVGTRITVKKTDSSTNAVTLDPNSTETIDGLTTLLLYKQYDFITVESNGTNWEIVSERVSINARVTHNAAQAIATATETTLAFNTETFDTAAIHDTVTNNGRLTVPRAGTYLIGLNISFAANATGYREARIRLNGSTVIADTVELNASGSAATRLEVTTLYRLAATDYVEARAVQTSGGNLDVETSSDFTPIFWIQRVGD